MDLADMVGLLLSDGVQCAEFIRIEHFLQYWRSEV